MLSSILEREHHTIDRQIEAFADASGSDPAAEEGLRRAIEMLRRHIYVEEELVFPPLRDAGLMMPVLVMLREHAQMWQALDGLERALDPGRPDPDAARRLCRQVLAALNDHNAKEEAVLYPQADRVLDPAVASRAQEVLDSGRLPDGWRCQYLQG